MKKRKRMSKLGKYVVLSLSVLIIYTIVELVLTNSTGMEHSTLTTCIFATFGGEVLSCCLIKIFKLKRGEKNEDYSEVYDEQ